MNEVINHLRNLKVVGNSVNERRLRAMVVARAFAYASPINTAESFTENLNRCSGKLEDAVQDINEGILLDIKLTLELFTALYKARYEVATSVCDPTLIKHVLMSTTQQDMLNEDSRLALASTLNDKDVAKTTREIYNVCNPVPEGE